MLNLSCLFGTVLLCCMLSYLQRCTACTQRMASYCSWEPLGTGGCKSAGWPPRPAARRGSPSSRDIPARPRWGHATAVKSVRMPCSNPSPAPVLAAFQRRSGAVPGPCRNGAGTALEHRRPACLERSCRNSCWNSCRNDPESGVYSQIICHMIWHWVRMLAHGHMHGL